MNDVSAEWPRGELCSRVLAENSKNESGWLFLFDEPTTGLHATDVEQLIRTFRELIDRGNSVVVIEHIIQLIENCDYVIDLGPDGGDQGGHVVAIGTPAEIAANPASITGRYLATESKTQSRRASRPVRGAAAT